MTTDITPDKKAPSDSTVHTTHLVLPEFTNSIGTIFGGQLMAWMDIAGAICAIRHCHLQCVTVSVDQLHFRAPVKAGHVVNHTARTTFVHVSSMEILVIAESENPLTGARLKTCTAYFTFVAKKDGKGGKMKVPGLLLTTDAEKKEFEEGAKRRKQRLSSSKAS